MSGHTASAPLQSPQLLVSVRSVEEARSAIDGGADIIDVKDPDRGSLGCADADVIAALASLSEFGPEFDPELRPEATPQGGGSCLPLSVALGEVHEFNSTDALALPRTVAYAKLGIARLRGENDWADRWLSVRKAFDRRAASPVGWIAVIYADAEQAQSPSAAEIIEAAATTGCVGVLVDTYSKTGGQLLDYVPPPSLAQWARTAQGKNLLFAVAGRLSLVDLPLLSSVSPDIIAVRSAACEGADRLTSVRRDRVANFRRAIASVMTTALPLAATR